MKKIFLICGAAGVLFLSGCVASSMMTVNVSDTKGNSIAAQVFVDGESIGNAPATKKVSNGVWNDPAIRVVANGYAPYNSDVLKEAKAANMVIGCIINPFAWLWCYGPRKQQYVILQKE
jgi:PBP1b-binding outer membrane lipoprotein LpoB